MALEKAIPILRVFDHELALKFYVEWLGFKIDWVHRFDETAPRYIQISRDNVLLHLTEHYGDCTPGARVYVRMSDVAEYHRELCSRPNPNMRPGLETSPWGSKCMDVVDPFGNRISFDEPVAKKD
ncbi:MAG: glyoxalase superfamily protein [Candidatus Hydrogenedentes bacterium]|nr:glyoxalase superfamily protein [Candidatus Hydrogenedentota bacterium]